MNEPEAPKDSPAGKIRRLRAKKGEGKPAALWQPSQGGAFSDQTSGFEEDNSEIAPLPSAASQVSAKKSGKLTKAALFEQENSKQNAKSKAKTEQPHYLGHRQRLRERFAKSEAGIADYELLELLLFRSIARGDVKATAKTLIARFGALSEVLAAPPERLMEVPGVGPAVAHDLKVVEAAGRRLAHGAVINRQVLGSWSSVIDYCRASMAFAEREELRLLFLDKKNGLMADEVMQKGTVDHTPVYPREIIRRALTLNSSAIILVHNHPTGDPTPSRADIEMTREIVSLAEPLGIVVHDHLIIGRKGHASFRALGLL